MQTENIGSRSSASFNRPEEAIVGSDRVSLAHLFTKLSNSNISFDRPRSARLAKSISLTLLDDNGTRISPTSSSTSFFSRGLGILVADRNKGAMLFTGHCPCVHCICRSALTMDGKKSLTFHPCLTKISFRLQWPIARKEPFDSQATIRVSVAMAWQEQRPHQSERCGKDCDSSYCRRGSARRSTACRLRPDLLKTAGRKSDTTIPGNAPSHLGPKSGL
jgi:hypothetical protein